jgi:Ni,Fe-hydrogenase III component G
MSGGSHDYICYKVEELEGQMHDKELDILVKDFAELLHDLEWWDSCDYSEETYRTTVRKFKEKWFGKRDERLKQVITESCYQLEKELLEMIGK